MKIEKLEQAEAIHSKIVKLKNTLERLDFIKSNFDKGMGIYFESDGISIYLNSNYNTTVIDILQTLKTEFENQLSALEKELEEI